MNPMNWSSFTTSDKALWALAGGAWLLGRRISKDEHLLALCARTPAQRAVHQDQAQTYNLLSNAGAAYIGWQFFKVYPRATAGVALGLLALGALPTFFSVARREAAEARLHHRAPQPLPQGAAATAGPFGPYPYYVDPNYNYHWQ